MWYLLHNDTPDGKIDNTIKIDDNIFLQGLVGVKENSLKDKIETANLENDENEYLNIIKHSSYYGDIDNFKNYIKNYKMVIIVLSSNIQCINSKFNELNIFVEELRETHKLVQFVKVSNLI